MLCYISESKGGRSHEKILMATAKISFCWSLTTVVVLSNKPPPIKEIYSGWSLGSQSRQKFRMEERLVSVFLFISKPPGLLGYTQKPGLQETGASPFLIRGRRRCGDADFRPQQYWMANNHSQEWQKKHGAGIGTVKVI